MSGQQQELKSMSSPPLAAADAGGTRRVLRADLLRLGRSGGARAATSSAAVSNGYDSVEQHVRKWLPLAVRRREAAVGSPADQARWDRLIEAVTRPKRPSEMSYEELVVLASSARELLRALRSTEPPVVPVAEVAQRIKQRIKDGIYAPGATLSPGRIAADLGLPLESVSLAMVDLADSGVIEKHANCRARVPGTHLSDDRPRQLAEWLQELVAAGVYPPGAALPARRELARILVTSQEPLIEALCILVEKGTLECDPNRRLTVRRDACRAIDAAHAPTCRLSRLPEPASEVDLTSTGIREAVRKAHAWWSARLSPPPASVDHCIDHLCAAAHHLVGRVRRDSTLPAEAEQHLRAVIARTAATAAAVHHPGFELRVWRAACLATAVGDLLGLVEELEDCVHRSAVEATTLVRPVRSGTARSRSA
ncbi:GntR family transcriptional regulator [Streptomyces inhibens]|uniref:GntR family transcriptional regulator n=1 Tax=Streptomyces inhibens TaxID=2293571 RepID=UPI00402B01BA